MRSDIERFEMAIRSFMRIMYRPHMWEAVIEAAGVVIDRPGATILMIIKDIAPPNGIRLNDLAAKLNIEAPSVSRKVQQLEAEQLVAREHNDLDKRTSYVNLTDRGKAVAQKIQAAQRSIIEHIFNGWKPQDRQVFTSLFERFSTDLIAAYARQSTQTNSSTKQ